MRKLLIAMFAACMSMAVAGAAYPAEDKKEATKKDDDKKKKDKKKDEKK